MMATLHLGSGWAGLLMLLYVDVAVASIVVYICKQGRAGGL